MNIVQKLRNDLAFADSVIFERGQTIQAMQELNKKQSDEIAEKTAKITRLEAQVNRAGVAIFNRFCADHGA
jgi:hypothetical protein